ncbi:MAG: hypothetical protein Q8P57_05360 [Candidatus Pacearchaeota archaeon]|nr:hypothetical protein [Candidatus Pacearchaeota archaeon]
MASYENFYAGGGESLSSEYGTFVGYRNSVSGIGFPTDPTTANQLKKVSDKISTGAKTIEVSGLSILGGAPLKHLATIPKQHWKEIDRLRKLTGVDLTFHGPLVEPTGYSGRGNWSKDQRLEVEGQMKSAIELAHQINPKGNVVVTFHASNGLPEVRKRIKKPDGTIQTTKLAIFNERTGQVNEMPLSPADYLDKIYERTAEQQLASLNNTQWTDDLQKVAEISRIARNEVEKALNPGQAKPEEINQLLALHHIGQLAYQNKEYEELYLSEMDKLRKIDPNLPIKFQQEIAPVLSSANTFMKDAFLKLKESYNLAYHNAKVDDNKEQIKILDEYRNTYVDVMDKKRGGILGMQQLINHGVSILEPMSPKIFRPLEEFAVDKASDSFANTALHGYKKFGSNAPIIAVENPPAGLTGLTRADEIRAVVEKSREKFIQRAIETGVSKSEAKSQAEKLIGATWDVGHINSIRKWGYDKKDVIGEARTIAPFVKHVHIADNLGFEDSELPPGMGNVPIAEIMALDENFRKAKKIIETGDWFSRQGGLGMGPGTAIPAAFEGFGAPFYSTGPSPYWNQAVSTYGNYFSGLGPINPEIHHSVYGGSFTGLPADLGGQMPGRSGFSGTPME